MVWDKDTILEALSEAGVDASGGPNSATLGNSMFWLGPGASIHVGRVGSASSSSDPFVANRNPVPISTIPAISDTPTISPRVIAESETPRAGVARSAVDIVLARTWRPASTTAQ